MKTREHRSEFRETESVLENYLGDVRCVCHEEVGKHEVGEQLIVSFDEMIHFNVMRGRLPQIQLKYV